jgi:microcystin-dependent protein
MRYKISMLAAASTLAFAGIVPATAQDYYIGQVIEIGTNFCPRNFLDASGQILSIAQNQALFSLLGTTYGGNGITTFQLPDLRGRMLIGDGQGPGLSNYTQGQIGGQENVSHTIANLPAHIHPGAIQTVTGAGNQRIVFRNAFGVTTDNQYVSGTQGFDGNLEATTLAVQKSGTDNVVLPNMSPFLVTRYCIAQFGIFPSRN